MVTFCCGRHVWYLTNFYPIIDRRFASRRGCFASEESSVVLNQLWGVGGAQCKHQLAAMLASALHRWREVIVSDAELAHLLLQC